jgi:hypothetical protein
MPPASSQNPLTTGRLMAAAAIEVTTDVAEVAASQRTRHQPQLTAGMTREQAERYGRLMDATVKYSAAFTEGGVPRPR